MKDRNLRIEPIWKDGLPMCHDNCEARCLKPESVIESNGCYAWLRETGDFAPSNPTVCVPAIAEMKSQRDRLEDAT
jgi:hypothetical protein